MKKFALAFCLLLFAATCKAGYPYHGGGGHYWYSGPRFQFDFAVPPVVVYHQRYAVVMDNGDGIVTTFATFDRARLVARDMTMSGQPCHVEAIPQ